MSVAPANLPAALANETVRRFERFLEAAQAAEVNTSSFNLSLVNMAWTVSPFIAEVAIHDPAWFIEQITDVETAARTRAYYLDSASIALIDATNADDAFARLRQFRNRELARIAWRDIELLVGANEITSELSHFADACIHSGVEWARQQLFERFGGAYDGKGKPIKMIVIAMGKLGGRELNFSSDIDLIFAFPTAGDTKGGQRSVSHQEYFDKIGKLLIALLNEQTADGFVFRVDMRLRPFGDSGPLTSNFDALEHYYQLHGRDWERYAFIKARAVTGSEHDREKLRALLKPFVFRRYLDFGALEAVREMKAMISQEVTRKELEDNVKLGSGGIREIEFIGQTFQLIRGGQEPLLQNRSIIPTLEASQSLNLLEAQDTAGLKAAYLFLRRTEHRLQQVSDRQTHELPRLDTEKARLALGMGYANFAQFLDELNAHRNTVQRCFELLLRPEVLGQKEQSSNLLKAHALWHQSGGPNTLTNFGFDDPDAIEEVIGRLRNPRFLARLSREAQARLDRLMPQLLETLSELAPYAATFTRLAAMVTAVVRRSVYLSLLSDHPRTLRRLIELFDASPWIAQQITQQPLLLDELIDPRILFAPLSPKELMNQLKNLLARYGKDNVEHVMDTLREFKNQQVLRVAASDVMDQFPVAEVSNQLSYIAQALLHHAHRIANDQLNQKHGEPRWRNARESRRAGFAIIAYGKLGGFELGYGSDLDLVFIHDGQGEEQVTDGERMIANAVYFTRLVQRIIHFLNTRTGAGRAYEVDTRLRPNGNSGLVVTSISAFAEYQNHEAWTWEHQALLRARAVVGSPATMAAFERVRLETLSRPRDAFVLRAEIIQMRERMRGELDRSNEQYFDLKQGAGGITDIEFMVQYSVLRWAHEHSDLLGYTDNLRLLEALIRLGLMSADIGTGLHDAYFAYRAAIHRCTLQETDGLVGQTLFRDHRAAVTNVWLDIMQPKPGPTT